MRRITKRDLQAGIDRLNRITGNPMTPWTRDEDDKMTANLGNYHLSQAYGGYCVHQMHNPGGGVNAPVTHGHIPARDCYERLHSFINGYEQRTRDETP